MKLLNRYDEQTRKDALSLSEKGFCNTYHHFHSQEDLKRIYKDINNEPKRETRVVLSSRTDEATDFPDMPLSDAIKEREVLIEIVKATDAAQPEDEEEERYTPPPVKKVVIEGKTRSVRMKELIAEGLSKSEVKSQMESEGFEFKGSSYHSEYSRLNK